MDWPFSNWTIRRYRKIADRAIRFVISLRCYILISKLAFWTTQLKDNIDNIALFVFKLSLLRSRSGRGHIEHCVTPAWAASQETNSDLKGMGISDALACPRGKGPLALLARQKIPFPFKRLPRRLILTRPLYALSSLWIRTVMPFR